MIANADISYGAGATTYGKIYAGIDANGVKHSVTHNGTAYGDIYAEKSVLRRWATAEEIVGPTLFLASDAASYVTGTILFADGGWTAVDGRFTPPGM